MRFELWIRNPADKHQTYRAFIFRYLDVAMICTANAWFRRTLSSRYHTCMHMTQKRCPCPHASRRFHNLLRGIPGAFSTTPFFCVLIVTQAFSV